MARFDGRDFLLLLKILGFVVLVRLIVYFVGYRFYIPVLDEVAFWTFGILRIIFGWFSGLFPS